MARRPARKRSNYRVFISHAGDDIWIAEQLSRCIEDCGATTFLDRRDIAPGDNFKARIREELPNCAELVAFFAPWSMRRAWVRHEIGMADALEKRIVCVFYGVTIADFEAEADGLGPLEDLNIIELNSFETYLRSLKRRVK